MGLWLVPSRGFARQEQELECAGHASDAKCSAFGTMSVSVSDARGRDGNMSEIRSVFGDTARADGRAVAKASDLEVGRGIAQGMGRSPFSLTVNGQIRTMVVEPRMTLLDALRRAGADGEGLRSG
jgi:hypothetical protein